MLSYRQLPLMLLFAVRTAFSQTPYLLEDIHQPAEHLMLYSNSAHLNAHGKGFFSAYTAPAGDHGLYAFDGQTATLFQQYPAYMDKAMATDEGFFFFASIGSSQQQLWVTDLTPGHALLLDTVPFQSPNNYDNPAAVLHNVLYFSQQSTAEGRELWRSDGTPGGTYLLKDLRPGTASSWPDALMAGDSLIYFIATEYGGKKRIWRSNGTPDGTFSLTGDTVNVNQVWLNSLQVVGNTLFFQLRSPALGTEVWKSDGTVAGTVKVKTAGPPSTIDWYVYTAKIQNKYLFQMNDGVHGLEWWVSDGTFDGTKLLKDIHPGPGDTYSTYAANGQYRLVDDMIFFVEDNGWQIWKTNGTPQGTQLVKNIGEGQLSPTAAADHFVYPLLKKNDGELELWRTDGSTNGTLLVKNLGTVDYLPVECPSAVSGNSICFFFEIINPQFNDPDWVYMRSDGTPGGTNLLGGTPSPEFEHSSPDKFSAAADGSVLFRASPENGEARIYKVSANAPPSVSTIDNDIIPSYSDRGPYAAGGKAFWFATDSTLRVYDETGAVQQIDLPDNYPFVSAISFQNALYFLAKNGRSLWRSDGTAAGTFQVFLSAAQTNFYGLCATSDSLYMIQSVNIPGGGEYLWRSDGTTAGTAEAGLIPSNGSTLFPMIVNNRFAVTTYELTPPVMTLRVNGFPPLPLLGNYAYQPAGLEISGDRLIVLDAPHYAGSQPTYSLWAYEAGETTLLHEFESVVDYDPFNFNGISEQLYGVAGGSVIFGAGTAGDVDLWRSDGTLAGTFLLMDLNPSGSSQPSNFVRYDDQHWLFTAFDGSATAWWISDGTVNGTFKVADLWPVTPPLELTPIPSIDNAVLIQNRLFFSMNNGEIGFEPWVLELPDSLVSGLEPIVQPLSGLAIFPNPASESIQLSWPQSAPGALDVRLFDAGGKVVLTQKMARAGTESINIPLGHLTPGVYRIQTLDEKGLRATGSFVVLH